MGNLTKYGRNAFDEMNSHRTTRGRYKRRIKRFTKDMKHFATIAKGMVDQLGSAVLESVLHGDGIEKAMKLAYAYDDITLNKVIAKQLKKERESIPSDEARLVYGTAIVQLYLNKFMKNFRGLSYK